MSFGAWDLPAAAALAPVTIWLLWRAQTLSVELLRGRLVKLALRGDTKWLYAIVSWFGVLLHEVSHASVLLLSGHGIREFRSGVEEGHVTPTRMRRTTVGFLSFLAAALAPLFLPPALVVVGLVLLVDRGLVALPSAAPGFDRALAMLTGMLVQFPQRLVIALGNLDLARWPHALMLALVLVALPSSRPSHIKGSRFHGTNDEGDVAVLRARIRESPWLFALFLVALLAAYALVLVVPVVYWWPIAAVWMLASAGIALALFGAVWWGIAGLAGLASPWLAWLGPAAFVGAEIGLRLAGGGWPLWTLNAASLGAWLAVALLLVVSAPRRGG